MQRVREIPWSRIGAESVAIVVSILLAFAINAWWADRVERVSQLEELSQLHQEFLEVREQLRNESRELKQTATEQLLQMVQQHMSREDPLEVSNSVVRDVLSRANYDVVTPVLDGIILSGRLDGIESQRVVSAISEWRSGISDLVEYEAGLTQILQTQLFPVFIERGNISGSLVPRPRLSGTTKLMVDDQLEGYLSTSLLFVRGDITRLESLVTVVDELLGALEEAVP